MLALASLSGYRRRTAVSHEAHAGQFGAVDILCPGISSISVDFDARESDDTVGTRDAFYTARPDRVL